GSGATSQDKYVVRPCQTNRTGPTQIIGIVYCPAIQDYFDLINSKGGVEGYKIKYNELDNEYKVPQAVEEYERQKQMGAVSMLIYGTPQAQALNQKLVEDKIPGTSPGFGISASADGKRFPYLFPVAATYWSQSAAAIKVYEGAGYPLSKVIGLVWASAEADILAAGGWAVAEGYHTLQFAGAGDDYPIRQDIKAMYKAQGKEPPKGMDDTVIYNRALLNTAPHVEASRNPIKT